MIWQTPHTIQNVIAKDAFAHRINLYISIGHAHLMPYLGENYRLGDDELRIIGLANVYSVEMELDPIILGLILKRIFCNFTLMVKQDHRDIQRAAQDAYRDAPSKNPRCVLPSFERGSINLARLW